MCTGAPHLPHLSSDSVIIAHRFNAHEKCRGPHTACIWTPLLCGNMCVHMCAGTCIHVVAQCRGVPVLHVSVCPCHSYAARLCIGNEDGINGRWTLSSDFEKVCHTRQGFRYVPDRVEGQGCGRGVSSLVQLKERVVVCKAGFAQHHCAAPAVLVQQLPLASCTICPCLAPAQTGREIWPVVSVAQCADGFTLLPCCSVGSLYEDVESVGVGHCAQHSPQDRLGHACWNPVWQLSI